MSRGIDAALARSARAFVRKAKTRTERAKRIKIVRRKLKIRIKFAKVGKRGKK